MRQHFGHYLDDHTKRRWDDFYFWVERNWSKWAKPLLVVIIIGAGYRWSTRSVTKTSFDPAMQMTVIDIPCDTEEEYARFKQSGGAWATRCPDNSGWLRSFAANDPNPEKTAVFIGCNKVWYPSYS